MAALHNLSDGNRVNFLKFPYRPLLARIEGIKAAINTGARNRALRGLYVFNAEIRRSRKI